MSTRACVDSRDHYFSSTIGFDSTPTFSMSISQVSPPFMNTGGLRAKPTPEGVPVISVVRLHGLAVEPGLNLEALAAGRKLVGGHHPGTEAAGIVEVLAHVPLRGLALEFAH